MVAPYSIVPRILDCKITNTRIWHDPYGHPYMSLPKSQVEIPVWGTYFYENVSKNLGANKERLPGASSNINCTATIETSA